jgi:hypothetical protein
MQDERKGWNSLREGNEEKTGYGEKGGNVSGWGFQCETPKDVPVIK